jgi:hypothetical protein
MHRAMHNSRPFMHNGGWANVAMRCSDRGRRMTDLKDPRLIYLKGLLFLVLGCLAAGLVVAERPTIKVAALLAIAIWSFCRFYYFAFYVIEHYVDSSYKFAGLTSVAAYFLQGEKRAGKPDQQQE